MQRRLNRFYGIFPKFPRSWRDFDQSVYLFKIKEKNMSSYPAKQQSRHTHRILTFNFQRKIQLIPNFILIISFMA